MNLTHEVVTVHPRRTFRIAVGAHDAFRSVVCRVEHAGVVGLGEASPSSRVTGEDAASVGRFLDHAAVELRGLDPAGWGAFLDRVHAAGGNPSARAALDLALHDLAGKLEGKPARAFYDLPHARLETCLTVSLDAPDAMAEQARGYREEGYRVLKLKLGDAARDEERVEAVMRAVPDARVRADANTGWTRQEAERILPRLARLGVEFVEQPVHPSKLEDLAALSRASPLPVYADESVLDAADVARLHEAGFRGGVNLKLQKTGGIRPALAAARLAKDLGYRVQLGCNVETAIGIAGGVQLLGLLDHADLDGNLLLADDPFEGAPAPGGWLETPSAPGLGVRAR